MLKLTSLFLLVVCALVLRKTNAISEEERNEMHKIMKPIMEECSKQQNISPEELAAAKKNKDISLLDSCLVECVFKKMDIMDDEDAFVPEKYADIMKKILKKDGDSAKIDESAKNCASVNDSDAEDKCAKSKALFVCLMEQKDLLGL